MGGRAGGCGSRKVCRAVFPRQLLWLERTPAPTCPGSLPSPGLQAAGSQTWLEPTWPLPHSPAQLVPEVPHPGIFLLLLGWTRVLRVCVCTCPRTCIHTCAGICTQVCMYVQIHMCACRCACAQPRLSGNTFRLQSLHSRGADPTSRRSWSACEPTGHWDALCPRPQRRLSNEPELDHWGHLSGWSSQENCSPNPGP